MGDVVAQLDVSARRAFGRKLITSALVAAAIYAGFALYIDVDKLGAELARISLRGVLSALLLATLSFAVRFGRWQFLLNELEIRPRWVDSALIFTSGLGMSITPGKAGELLKAVMLKQATGVRVAAAAPVVVAERVSDLFALVLLAALGLPAGPWRLPAVAAAVLLVAGATAALSYHRLGVSVIEWLTSASRTRRLRAGLIAGFAMFSAVFEFRRMLIGLVFGCAAWLLHCAAFAAIAGDLLDAFSFRDAVLANSAPLLLGAAAMVPGGLGVAEASMTGVIIALGGHAARPDQAAALTVAVRLVTLWWAVALGLASLAWWQFAPRDTERAVE